MKRMAIAALAVAMAVGFSAALMADETPGATNQVDISGKVKKIDGKALTITTATVSGALNVKTTDTVILCNNATKFTREGAAANAPAVTLGDLKVGMRVQATYTKADNVNTAAQVTIMGSILRRGETE